MSKFEILNDLIEGKLKDASEKSVYAELSADSAMRSELRNLLSVNNSINSNKALFVPRAGSKKAIFNKIGLVGGGVAATSFWNSKWFYSAVSSVATIIIMLGIYFGLDEFEESNQNDFVQEEIQYSKKDLTLSMLSELDIEPIKEVKLATKESYNNTTSQFNSEVHYNNSNKNSNIISKRDEESNLQSNKILEKSNLSNTQVSQLMTKNINYVSKIHNDDAMTNQLDSKNISLIDNNNIYSRFSIEWNNSESVHIPEERITPSEFALFHKNSISLLYDLSSKLTIGANARQETFYLVFRGLGEDGIQRIYEQQPNLTSFSGFMRYNLFEYQENLPVELESFVEMQLGGNAIGPVGRFGFGLEIRPTRNITFVVSGQYSQLRYWHQNNGFKTEKFSLNYGVRFGL